MEILFILTCTTAAFAILLLAFVMKGSAEKRPSCGRCTCHQASSRLVEAPQSHPTCKSKLIQPGPIDSLPFESTR